MRRRVHLPDPLNQDVEATVLTSDKESTTRPPTVRSSPNVLLLLILIAGMFFLLTLMVFQIPLEGTPEQPLVDLPSDTTSMSLFSNTFENAPECTPLKAETVSFSLVTQCSQDRLWMMGHHCQRWGENHPISLVVFTTQTMEQVVQELIDIGCTNHQISKEGGGSVQIVDSSQGNETEYPINALRNLALRAVTTSHVFLVDIDFWLSTDVYQRLMDQNVREALVKEHQLAIVVPAFQIKSQCGDQHECHDLNIPTIPSTMKDLNKLLKRKKATVFDPTNWQGHRTTNYNAWFQLGPSELYSIPCFKSNRYEPYLSFRYCNVVPPFQTAFTGYGKNKLTWIMQLRHNGYVFQTIGKAYITHYPHLESKSRVEWNKRPQELKGHARPSQVRGRVNWLDFKRGAVDALYIRFTEWLGTMPDKSRISICDHVGGDGVELWADVSDVKN